MLLWIFILSKCALVTPSPMDNFLSARAVRCSLAGGLDTAGGSSARWAMQAGGSRAGWGVQAGGWRAGWGTRRQHYMVPPTNSGEQNLLNAMPNYKLGPQKSEKYSPNYGYEPYWADGGWVFHPSSNSTPELDDYCGNVCAPSYKHYGVICAKNLHGEYKTFPNYCAMKDSDCTDEERLKIVYKGPCIESGEAFKGHPGHISVKYTLGKPQPGIAREVVQRFFDLYRVPIGSSLHNGTTKAWTYTPTFTDY